MVTEVLNTPARRRKRILGACSRNLQSSPKFPKDAKICDEWKSNAVFDRVQNHVQNTCIFQL